MYVVFAEVLLGEIAYLLLSLLLYVLLCVIFKH